MSEATAEPRWDERQRAVIGAQPIDRVIVTAGPGEGKSAIACARIAHLINEGVTPSKILLISFTRTAVAEIRNRIRTYVRAERDAAEVRITTIDSHAWQLRNGFDVGGLPRGFNEATYEASIEAVVALLRKRDEGLIEFLQGFEHVLIDEAQDVVGIRADLIVELVSALDGTCGVTVFADPAQAIYGFTTDDDDGSRGADGADVMTRLRQLPGCAFRSLGLGYIYRVSDRNLATLFERCRESVIVEQPANDHLARVRSVITANASTNLGALNHKQVAEWCATSDSDALVLFRQRADVWVASSYCASSGAVHRLRLSGAPTIVFPWLAWTLSEHTDNRITKSKWDELWALRSALAPALYEGADATRAWSTLRRFAGAPGDAVGMDTLRAVVARPRPPVEFCVPDWGATGPIIGTIHASKGREASRVVLVMLDPPRADDADTGPRKKKQARGSNGIDAAELLEEGRVLYVGATRGKTAVLVGEGKGAYSGALESGRAWRSLRKGFYQLEVGREGDVDRIAHLTWPDSHVVQQRLASAQLPCELAGVGRSDWHWQTRLFLKGRENEAVGQLTSSFQDDQNQLWSRNKGMRPGPLSNIHLVGITSIALRDDERDRAEPPFRASGFALAPVIRGFAFLSFFPKRK